MRTRLAHGVQPHRERFDQGAQVGRDHQGRTMEAGTTVYSAKHPAAGQAVEAEAAAQVGQPGPALGALAAEQGGLHRDRVTLREAGHALADLGDLAGELVAELDRVPLPVSG